MNKNAIIAILAIAVIGIGGYMFMNRTAPTSETTNVTVNEESNASEPSESEAMTKETTTEATTMEAKETTEEGEVKEFSVIAKSFLYNQKELRVKKGDTVRIVLDNQDGMHDFVIDEFNAKTKVLKAGETETIEFVADQTGTFEYYCSVGNHRAQGMVGNLIVE